MPQNVKRLILKNTARIRAAEYAFNKGKSLNDGLFPPTPFVTTEQDGRQLRAYSDTDDRILTLKIIDDADAAGVVYWGYMGNYLPDSRPGPDVGVASVTFTAPKLGLEDRFRRVDVTGCKLHLYAHWQNRAPVTDIARVLYVIKEAAPSTGVIW
jgi:hypothetical protein